MINSRKYNILNEVYEFFCPIYIYLTIRLRARDFYEVIVDEGESRINYHLVEIESE